MPNSVRPGFVVKASSADSVTRPARMGTELSTTPFTAFGVADPRLVDPYMEQVVETAKAEAREDGFKEGYEAGFERGRAEGLELLAAQQREFAEQDAVERAGRRERLIDLVGSVERAVAGALDYQVPRIEEMRDLVTEMSVQIAEMLVGHHLEVRDCAARDAVRRTLESIPRRTSVTLRMHPEDHALVEDILRDTTEWEISRVVPDLSVDRGDCYAEADNLEVEATMEGAIERVRKVLNP